jgi:outer membrane cobalamin receptor
MSASYIHSENRVTNAGYQVRWEQSNRQDNPGSEWFVNATTTNWAFLEHEYQLTSTITLRGGLSGHMFMYDSWERTSSSIDPSINVIWTIGEYTITGAASRVTRFPTLHQLFSSSSGNPDLKPEWAVKGELTFARSFPGIGNIAVTGFINTLHDMIDRSGRLLVYHNIAKATINGAEIGGSLVLDGFNITSNVTLLDAHDGDGNELDYRPPWKIDTTLTYPFFKQFQVNIISRMVGRRWTQSFKRYVDSYHVEDIGLKLWDNRMVSVSLMMKNIFDLNYEEEYTFPMSGRTLWIGIDWDWNGI